MRDQPRVVWFWQRIVSPHMAGLACELSRRGCNVTYVAEQLMSEDRARQGWSPPELDDVRLEVASTSSTVQALVAAAPPESIHICQGIRANGLVGKAQRALASRGLRQWVVMETVEDSGWRGLLKRLEYSRLFAQWRDSIEGVLAAGLHTPDWVVARNVPAEKVFPFAYFLSCNATRPEHVDGHEGNFRFVFVGQFIERKRLNLLIAALADLGRTDIDLAVIGSGPLEAELRLSAETSLQGRIDWIGRLPMNDVQLELAKADCLVLPSRYDGWGAVVSESLMAGTPAICSDRCGSAVAVHASGYGGVFRSCNVDSLVVELKRVLTTGKLASSERLRLSDWAQCLGANAGADYLLNVFDCLEGNSTRPLAPWLTDRRNVGLRLNISMS